MGKLNIYVSYDLDDGTLDIDYEATFKGHYDIERDLGYDKDFQDLLAALGERFTQLVDKRNKE